MLAQNADNVTKDGGKDAVSRRSSKRSRPLLRNDSVYERAGNSSFKQRFCTHSIFLDNFWSNQDAKQDVQIQEQSEL